MGKQLTFAGAIVLVLAVLGGLVLVKKGDGDTGPAERQFPPTSVVLAEVGVSDISDVIEALGTAQAAESIDVTAKVTDTVSKIAFDDGMAVEAGDTIVELTDAEESARLDEARAQLEQATKQYDRIAGLVRRGNGTQSSLDDATAVRDRAAAQVTAIEAQLADRIIKAPFSGVLGLRQVSLGTLVRPGDVITTLDDISVIKIDFNVPELFLGSLERGLQLNARSRAFPEAQFNGTVRTIDSRVDPVTRMIKVRAEIPNPDGLIKPGMLLVVMLSSDEREAVVVPETAIVQVGEVSFVYQAVEGERGLTAKRVNIETGARRPGTVEVVSGLAKGDRIVTEGAIKLRPNAPIRELGDGPPKGPGGRPGGPAPGASAKPDGEKAAMKPGEGKGSGAPAPSGNN